MKKHLINLLLLLGSFLGAFAQKNDNGIIYDKHPGIDVAENLIKAYVNADSSAISKLTTDDFKAFNSLNTDWDYKGKDRIAYIKEAKYWNANLLNFAIKGRGKSYPDAFEYKKDGTAIYLYDFFYGINKNTGFKILMPCDFVVNLNTEGTKVKSLMFSTNMAVMQKNTESAQTLTNGILYKNHPNIVKVRKHISNLELGKIEEAFVDFESTARIDDINLPYGTFIGINDFKNNYKNLISKFEILGIDEKGYPDMLDHEGPGSVVDSWWSMRMRNKSNNKKFSIYYHVSHTFNDEGKIIRQVGYYNGSQISASGDAPKK